ncbi:hypothetical protein [Marivivens marinus]|uniref:hypothetical protein n=1 Tax=Marivivens marinus TaxID=3110173 RepID=UPI003B84608C
MKTTTMIDGVKVIKLSETHASEHGRPSDSLAMFHIWTLLTGAETLRDLTVSNRALR